MKLVRDEIPNLYPEWRYRKATPWERPNLLRQKLREEEREFWVEIDLYAQVEELADMHEVLRAMALHLGCPWDEVEARATEKRRHRGGFGDFYVSEGRRDDQAR